MNHYQSLPRRRELRHRNHNIILRTFSSPPSFRPFPFFLPLPFLP
ncbi:hypothetical protein HMPREF1986_01158 [Oribacterium sp. oral taxon 078 str. F0263]|nr:hypothetical protein HMPREF1986_01158 [Oribacterium sp. oral taxon 078 str. F0263]